MKVLICTDMEGISGVYDKDQCVPESPLYQSGRERLMADTNVAVKAAFDAGAEKVYVVDGHHHGCNFIKGALDPRATQVWVKDMAWAIKDVDAAVIVGQHAMSGTMNAFIDHTMMSERVHHYRYDGERVGEFMIVATFCGYFGVPLVALTGDDAACDEAINSIAGITVASVKKANGRNKAICIPEKEAEKRIYEAVKAGIENRDNVKPVKRKIPFTVSIEYNRSDYCEQAIAENPKFHRVDAYTASRVVDGEIVSYYDVL